MLKPSFLSLTAILALSACGGNAPEGNGTAATATPVTATAGSYNPTDACATLPKEKVAAATGKPVESATLGAVTQPTEQTAGFSTCTYTLAGGGTIAFFARQSPVDDNTPEAIATTKKAVADNLGATIVDEAGLGTSAFSAEQMHQLHVFFGGNKYIYFMAPTPPAGAAILDVEKALAKEVVG